MLGRVGLGWNGRMNCRITEKENSESQAKSPKFDSPTVSARVSIFAGLEKKVSDSLQLSATADVSCLLFFFFNFWWLIVAAGWRGRYGSEWDPLRFNWGFFPWERTRLVKTCFKDCARFYKLDGFDNGRLKRRQLSMLDPVFDHLLLWILPKDYLSWICHGMILAFW